MTRATKHTLEFRRRARSKMAYIDASIPDPKEEGKPLHCYLTGTIVCAENEFLYVVVRSSLIDPRASYHVVLPDGSQIDIASEAFSKLQVPGGLLSGFYIKHGDDVEYDIQQISAVEFGGDVSVFEQVYLCDFVRGNFNITGGQVISVDGVVFTHSCSPTPNTVNGAPVLDADGRFAGISVANMQGPTNALSRVTLEKELNKIVNSENIEHFSKLIYMGGWDVVRDIR